MQSTRELGNSGVDTRLRHPIRVVSRQTGIAIHTLRAWERRHGVIDPNRSKTNRRLYSDADIEKLRLLGRAVASGYRISDAARFGRDELSRLVVGDKVADATAPQGDRCDRDASAAKAHLRACLAAVEALSANAFDAAIEKAAVALSRRMFLNEVITPLMHHLGERWRDGSLRITHEHLATTQLRSFLGMLLATSTLTKGGPALVIAAPEGQMHELGALVAAVTAATEGWQVVYLGPNVPMEGIATAAEKQAARAIALSLTLTENEQQLARQFEVLRQKLGSGVCLLAGGAAAPRYRQHLEPCGVQIVDGLGAFTKTLAAMRC